tara:strand:- start:100 stop:285 length:186 start_codon:yes stop_codon:yes gene_type:complete
MKKYNSVLTLSFSVDHDEENGADLNPDDVRAAFNNRLATMTDQELWESVGGGAYLEDTIEN